MFFNNNNIEVRKTFLFPFFNQAVASYSYIVLLTAIDCLIRKNSRNIFFLAS